MVDLNHSRPVSTIEHALYPVDSGKKLDLLRARDGRGRFSPPPSSSPARSTVPVGSPEQLEDSGHRAVALQGNMSQNQRDRAMQGFRDRRFQVLVATDIAARGIDVEKVSHVINFDMPGTVDAYTHRIGRTGRSEREGKGYTFVTADDQALVRAVESKIGTRIPRRTVAGIADVRFADERAGAARSKCTTTNRPATPSGRRQARTKRRRFRRAS